MKAFLCRCWSYVKSNINIILVILLFASFFTRFKYYLTVCQSQNGLPKTHDSYWYIDHARELIQNFSISFDLNGILYLGYYGLLSLILLIFNSDIPMIILQVILNSLGVVLVYRIAQIAFNSRVALFASLVYIFTFEIKFWSVYLLTDSMFLFLLLLTVYLFLRYGETGRKSYLYAFLGFWVYMIFIRPAGLFTAAFVTVFLITRMNYKKLAGYLKRKPYVAGTVGIASIAVIIFAGVKMLYSPLGMSFYWNLRWLLYGNYASGQVFDIPTLYDHIYKADFSVNHAGNFFISFFLNNPVDIFKLYVKRIGSFWGGLWIWHYNFGSIKEAVRYFIRLAPLVLMLVGMLGALRAKYIEKSIMIFIPVVSSVLFCMIFFIDSGWRYRLPSVPFSGIFIAAGIDTLLVFARDICIKNSFVKKYYFLIREKVTL